MVPIHQGIHWVLGVIHLEEQRLEFLDSMGGSDQGELLDPGELCTRMCFTGGGVGCYIVYRGQPVR